MNDEQLLQWAKDNVADLENYLQGGIKALMPELTVTKVDKEDECYLVVNPSGVSLVPAINGRGWSQRRRQTMSVRNIRFRHSADTFIHDDTVSETTIRANVPNFFRAKHGKRETFTVYHGCIIARMTVQFTGRQPERRTVVYIYTNDLEGSPNTLHISGAKNVRHAKRLIDAVLEAQDLRVVHDSEIVNPNDRDGQ